MVVAVDIGNSSVSCALVDSSQGQCGNFLRLPTSQIQTQLAAVVQQCLDAAGCDTTGVAIVLSSVVPALRAPLSALLEGHFGANPLLWLDTTLPTPFDFSYENPARFGADRMADLFYVWRYHPGRAGIVIDAGTAINIEAMSAQGFYAGGLILPGIAAQYAALSHATAALPLIEPTSTFASFPGHSTRECIEAGVCYGSAGAVRYSVERIQGLLGEGCVVLGTGGSWPALAPLVSLPIETVESLTLLGIAAYADYHRG